MFHYLWWMPITALVAIVGAYSSIQVNKNPQSLWFWFMFLPITVWPFVSRISKNIVFDGILYDSLVAVAWLLGFILFGASKDFTWMNYLGLMLAVIGLTLIKV